MIDRSIWVPTFFNCKVESATHFIPFLFISVHSDTLLLSKSGSRKCFFLLNKIRQHVAENRNEPVSKMAASFGRKTMLLPQVLRSVLKIFISKIDRKYAENMRYPRPRLGCPNSFSGRSLRQNFVAQTNVWSHLATMRPAVSSTVIQKLFFQNVIFYIPIHCTKLRILISLEDHVITLLQ